MNKDLLHRLDLMIRPHVLEIYHRETIKQAYSYIEELEKAAQATIDGRTDCNFNCGKCATCLSRAALGLPKKNI